jgi:hypothetical protein
MPKFGEVFSTTLKVLGALFLISLGGGLIYLVVGGIGASVSNSPSTTDSSKGEPDRYAKEADDRHTSMPLSQWNKLVAVGIKQHCAFEGMSREDAEQALGKPSDVSHYSDGAETWTYSIVDEKNCKRYDGDKCAEYAKHEKIVFFTPAGHIKLGDTGEGCYKEPFLSMRLKMETR